MFIVEWLLVAAEYLKLCFAFFMIDRMENYCFFFEKKKIPHTHIHTITDTRLPGRNGTSTTHAEKKYSGNKFLTNLLVDRWKNGLKVNSNWSNK